MSERNHRYEAAHGAARDALLLGGFGEDGDVVAHAIAAAVEAAVTWQGHHDSVWDGTGWRMSDGTISPGRPGARAAMGPNAWLAMDTDEGDVVEELRKNPPPTELRLDGRPW